MPASLSAADAVDAAVAAEWGRIVGSLIAITGDWDLAEDAAQDAVVSALGAWERDGVPINPAAWLTRAARNRAVDLIRRDATRIRSTELLGAEIERGWLDPDDPDPFPADDERLRLIYTCCHPALPLEARVALTLRTVLGLTPAELARAFLTTEQAMEKRLVRARAKIRNSGIPYRIPSGDLLGERSVGVANVLYLLFTEGYAASSGEHPQRRALADEAIRLVRIVRDLTPASEPQTLELDGLLALMLVQNARRDARLDADGSPVRLADQDRTLWDRTAISEAEQLISGATMRASHARQAVGPFLLQAAIAFEHARAATPDETDHHRIAELYGVLARVTPSPIVELNRAIAVANAEGPAAGLEVLRAVVDELADNHLLHAARADLLVRLGRAGEAADAWARAAELAPTDAERRVLEDLARAPR